MFGIDKKRNKKGSIQDLIMIGVVLTLFASIVLFGFMITSKVNDKIQDTSLFNAQGKTAATKLTGTYTGIIDNSFLFLTIGLCIVALILAAMVRIHPIFIPIFFIALIIIIFFCGILSNIYQGFAENSEMVAYANQLTFTSNILEYLPLIVGVFGMLLMVVMYKVWQNAQ